MLADRGEIAKPRYGDAVTSDHARPLRDRDYHQLFCARVSVLNHRQFGCPHSEQSVLCFRATSASHCANSKAAHKAAAKTVTRNTVFEGCVSLVCWKTVLSWCVPTASSFTVSKLLWGKHRVAFALLKLSLGPRSPGKRVLSPVRHAKYSSCIANGHARQKGHRFSKSAAVSQSKAKALGPCRRRWSSRSRACKNVGWTSSSTFHRTIIGCPGGRNHSDFRR